MRIGLMTLGTAGDVRPFCALAGGLASNGHEVTLAVASVDNKDYTELGDAMGFKVIAACKKIEYEQGEIDELIIHIMSRRLLLDQYKILMEQMVVPAVDDMFQVGLDMCAKNDMVIAHLLAYPLLIAAKKDNIPTVAISTIPTTYRTSYDPPETLPNLGRWMNSLFWKFTELGGAWILKPTFNRLAAQIGLPPFRSPLGEFWENEHLNFICVSPTICKRYPDWKDNIHIPGFFDIPDKSERWEIPGDLLSFLDYGEPPVFMTFGSFNQVEIEKNVELMTETAKLLGRKVIIQAFWENVAQLPDIDNVYLVRKIPHHQIFPRCAAVVHHGGAGTTQSSLFCGCPSIVVSHAFDQFFWAARLQEIGVGGRPLQKRNITPQKLATVIREVVADKGMKQKAERMGQDMRNENGVKVAVELIEKWMK